MRYIVIACALSFIGVVSGTPSRAEDLSTQIDKPLAIAPAAGRPRPEPIANSPTSELRLLIDDSTTPDDSVPMHVQQPSQEPIIIVSRPTTLAVK